MKRILPLLCVLFLIACSVQPNPDVPATEPPAVEAPTVAPAIEDDVIVASATELPETLPPVPTPTPTPEPTPEPTEEPTPTPDPFRDESVTESKTNAAFWYCKPTEALKSYVIGMSYPENPKDAPVKLDDLRYVHILYVDFDGAEHEGALLVHKKVANDVIEIFEALYDAQYPLRSVKLLDDFGKPFDDGPSMSADNTSAYCCRKVTGKKYFSRHSYGTAIDVNPVENPYVKPGGSFSPKESEPYLDRTDLRPGMITEDDLCYKLFTSHGWKWGGHFKGEPDYQHFSKDVKGVTP
ncbi:MAG: M15 family metallopeptidase [Clostridia bacterium]|nr:M15 family metallopeptidase [Clostridia bacterium]